MANDNDVLILRLQKQIEEKKEKIQKGQKFSPITNCSLEFMGQRYNIHVLSEDILSFLIVQFSVYDKTAKELNLKIKISGYDIDDWLVDLQNKLTNLNIKQEQSKLTVLQTKLDNLLSNDARIERELKEIQDLLK